MEKTNNCKRLKNVLKSLMTALSFFGLLVMLIMSYGDEKYLEMVILAWTMYVLVINQDSIYKRWS